MAHLDSTVLLTGVNGQVGGQLYPLLRGLGTVVAPIRDELDLSSETQLREYIRQLRPRWIVNPAAYTAVDKAEREPELAYAINATAPRVLAEEALACGASMVHFSTDYVFAGSGTRPWTETDEVGPLGVYGASKLAGERAIAASGVTAFIFRTSWVYGVTGNNFLNTILRLARERDTLKIVADQYGAPTWSHDLARLAVHAIHLCEEKAADAQTSLDDATRPFSGIYHACGGGFTTWYGFAQEFLRLATHFESGQQFAALSPISSDEYPTPAKRPLNSRMNCEKLAARLGFVMPAWQESVAEVMAQRQALQPKPL